MLKRIGDYYATKNKAIDRFVIWNRSRIDRLKARRAAKENWRFEMQFCVLGIMKNEARNIVEYVSHYRWQGAEKIYLIDNGSTDETLELIKPFLEDGTVELVQLHQRWKQAQHYWTAIKKFDIRKKSKWLLIADIDEFWFAKDGKRISDHLQNMDHADLIYANWTVFGSSGCEKHPQSLRFDLTKCMPDLGSDLHTKWIVRTHALKRYNQLRVHKVRGVRSSHTYTKNDIFQVNQYHTQSKEFWINVKMKRGDVYIPLFDDMRQFAKFEEIDAACSKTDHTLRDYVVGST